MYVVAQILRDVLTDAAIYLLINECVHELMNEDGTKSDRLIPESTFHVFKKPIVSVTV